MTDSHDHAEALGRAMGVLLSRSMVDDHFSGHFTEGVALRMRTTSGSFYDVMLEPGSISKVYTHTEDGASRDYNMRTGHAIINGKPLTGQIGFNIATGTVLILFEGGWRRSSSMNTIEQMDLIRG